MFGLAGVYFGYRMFAVGLFSCFGGFADFGITCFIWVGNSFVHWWVLRVGFLSVCWFDLVVWIIWV